MHTNRLTIALTLLLVTACAPASLSTGTAPTTRLSTLTGADLAKAHGNRLDDALTELRPSMLSRASRDAAVVEVDGARLAGGLNALRLLDVKQVQSVRYLSRIEAQDGQPRLVVTTVRP